MTGEAGNGRYDIQLKPLDEKRTAYILELKAVKERERLEEAGFLHEGVLYSL